MKALSTILLLVFSTLVFAEPEPTAVGRADAVLENLLNKTLSGAQLLEFNDDVRIGCKDFLVDPSPEDGDGFNDANRLAVFDAMTNEQKATHMLSCFRKVVREHVRQQMVVYENQQLSAGIGATAESNVDAAEAPW